MMQKRLSSALVFLVLASCFMAGCTRDPNVRKQKYLESGNRFLAKDKYREAAIQYQNALQVDPRFVEAHYQLSQAYLKLGALSGAAGELQRTLDLDANHVKGQIDYGNLVLVAGGADKFNQAQDHARSALSIEPNNVEAHILLANSYAGLQNMPAALDEMQKAIQIAPDRSRSYLNLAMLQAGAQQVPAAEASLKKALQLDPKSITARLTLGNFYEELQRWDEAEQQLRLAMQADPTNYLPVATLARLMVVRGRRADAEQLLQQAKKTLHDNPDGYRLLGDFYFALGDVDKASDEFASLYRQYPKDKRLKRDYVQILILRNKLDDATKLNNEILKENDKDVDALVLKGQILFRQKRAPESIQVLEAALGTEPDNPVAQYHLGVAFAQVGNLARAEAAWREAIRLRPSMSEGHQALAAVAIRKGDIGLLKSSAEALVNIEPTATAGYLLRALAKSNSADMAGADSDLRHALALAPNDPAVYTQLGVLRMRQQKNAEAQKFFEQALEKDPGFTEAMQYLVSSDLQQKQPAKAIARLNAQIAKSPNNSYYQAMLAQAYIDAGDAEKAETALNKAVALDNNNVDALLTLAQVQVQRGSLEQAVANFEKSIKDNPQDARAFLLLGVLEESRHNIPRARELYQKALQVQPDYPLAANNLAYLLVENGGSTDVALSLAESARRQLPTISNIADTLAWVYYRKGAYGLAIDLLQEALGQSPDNSTYHYHLALVYQKTEDKAKAREHFRRALQIDPKSEHAAEMRQALTSLGG
ncbi:MAG: tetratricopeptide repeat protein [Acidipila sp.]|nr:tetratricopeptide repeat protein [Acidipila sp.]